MAGGRAPAAESQLPANHVLDSRISIGRHAVNAQQEPAIAVDQEGRRRRQDVVLGHDVDLFSSHENLKIKALLLLPPGDQFGLFGNDVDGDHLHPLIAILVIKGLQMRQLRIAGPSGRKEEVDEGDGRFEISQRAGLAADRFQ